MKKIIVLTSFAFAFLSLNAYTQATGKNFGMFEELPSNTIQPQGWLKEFLIRQKTGLTGNHDALDYPFNTDLWNGVIKRAGNYGDEFWRYEQTAYLVDGIMQLGYLLNDKALIETGNANVNYALTHLRSNGRIGPEGSSEWPNAVFFRVLKANYLATNNPKIIDVLQQHYLSLTVKELSASGRNIVNIEGMLWVYGKTGNEALLKKAETAYTKYNKQNSTSVVDLTMEECLSPEVIVMHGVSYMEEAKIPAILYMYTGKRLYLDAATNAFGKLDRDHMLPDGIPSSNEFLGGKDIMLTHETCDITDYTWALGYLLVAGGDAKWADHIEKAMFNAGPGAVTKDFRSLQYLSCVNQPISTFESDHGTASRGEHWMAYSPVHQTECCSGNVNRFMPNFAARMWMQDKHAGLVAVFYGPSSITYQLPGTKDIIKVKEETNYPFSEEIVFEFESNKEINMPFTCRVPSWCKDAELSLNGEVYKGELKQGTFITIPVSINGKAIIKLFLPMKPMPKKVAANGLAIECGPLLFAYPVKTDAEIDTAYHARLNGKKANYPGFPAWNFRPNADWSYALLLDENSFADSIKIIRNKTDQYPLDVDARSFILRVPARKVSNWKLVEKRYTPPLPEKVKLVKGDNTEWIDLVPYGSTCLRISVFPVTIKN